MRHYRLLLVLGALGMSACADVGRVGTSSAPADSAAGELPLRLVGAGGAALVVPVHINGEGPIDLILDTGATLTCIDTSVVRRLSLPERRAVRGMAVGVGGAGSVRLHQADSLRVGAAVVHDLDVCAMDLQALRAVGPEVKGLLGLNVLRQFRVTLDVDRRVVRLSPPMAP